MYKTELVRRVAQKTGMSQRVVSHVLRTSLETIQTVLGAGERVIVPGFGYVLHQPAAGGTGALRAHGTPGGGAGAAGSRVPSG